MKKIICMMSVLLTLQATAQRLYLPKIATDDSAAMQAQLQSLANQVLQQYKENDQRRLLNNQFRLQSLTGDYAAAFANIKQLQAIAEKAGQPFPHLLYEQHALYIKARQGQGDGSFNKSFSDLLERSLQSCNDREAFTMATALVSFSGVDDLRRTFENTLAGLKDKDSITISEAIELCKNYHFWQVFKAIEPLAKPLLAKDDNRRYIIEDSILIRTKTGASISAYVVRSRRITTPQPASFIFSIYADPGQHLYDAKEAVTYGYIGVVANTRGKGLSTDEIAPYENEVKDVNEVIDWISRQPWSDGRVGMYGGSYSGFAQWAALKNPHPALKTVVPYVAAIPGQGLPMENNVFISANYGWAFYITNNRYLDNNTYFNQARWNSMEERWYKSGVPYRRIDSVDGTPNKWLQRWLNHPSYDAYWQAMVVYKNDFSKIKIPVLSVNGYYDDAQVTAIHYLKEHYKYNKNAEHYMVIGPYDHFGTQRGGYPVLREYTVDPVALFNTRQLTYEWFDYIFKGAKKPEMLKDKMNYEVMGANKWRHVSSFDKINNGFLTVYLSTEKKDGYYRLTTKKPAKAAFLQQEVDLADHAHSTNTDSYPYPIIRDSLDNENGLTFVTDPIDEPFSVDGTFSGVLKASINKKDMDLSVVLYEIMPDGRFFNLTRFLGRASYAGDNTKRVLLQPGKIRAIPFDRTRMVSRQLSKGSRLLIKIDINKNESAQVNYGTGKDVSDESVLDGKEPLRVKWYTDSFIKIPVTR